MPRRPARTTADVLRLLTELDIAPAGAELARAADEAGLAETLDSPWRAQFTRWAVGPDGFWPLRWALQRLGGARDEPLRALLSDPQRRAELDEALGYETRPFWTMIRSRLGRMVLKRSRGRLEQDALRALAERVGDPPEPEQKRTAWEAWAAGVGLGWFLEQPAIQITAPLDEAGTTFLEERGEDVTVIDALTAPSWSRPETWPKNSRKVPRSVQTDLRDALVERAMHGWLAEQDRLENPPPPHDAERWPALAALAEQIDVLAQAEDAVLLPVWRLSPRPGRLQIELDPPVAHWHPTAGPEGATVTVKLSAPIEAVGGTWPAAEHDLGRQAALHEVLTFLREPADAALADSLEQDLGVQPWERLIADLEAARADDALELGWSLRNDKDGWWLTPIARKLKGRSTKGRLLGLDELDRTPELMRTRADQAAFAALTVGAAVHIDGKKTRKVLQHVADRVALALVALEHHPGLTLDDGEERPLAVRRARPQLSLQEQREGEVEVVVLLGDAVATPEQLAMLARHEGVGPAMLLDPGNSRVLLVELPAGLGPLIRALHERGRRFPAAAAEPLLQRLDLFEQDTSVELSPGLAGPERLGDVRPVLRLELRGPTLVVHAWMQPIAGGRLLVPGEGAAAAYGMDGGGRYHVRRDLRAEERALSALADDLLLGARTQEGTHTWRVDDPDVAGRLVRCLAEREDVRVEWQGTKGQLLRSGGADSLRVRFRSLGEWFGVEGGLEVGSRKVDMQALLQAVEQGRRFLAVEGEGWLELDDDLQKALQAAAPALVEGEDGLMTAAVHAPLLAELEALGAQVDAPDAWRLHLDAFAAARTLEPEIPAALLGTPRDYQRDGFAWLVRLSTWAGGACLADDMGLGKTLQALALLVERAQEGPALVVVPASVGFNWRRESARFAPGLRVIDYRGKARSGHLETLLPGDLVVTTWALMARDQEELSGIQWATVVFDEAHAMKNPRSRRHRAARALQAGFRLALTGTPVENHAADLHSLFAVLLPGLLGTERAFRERFALPIAAGRVRPREALASLVRPFVLRRLKSEVAQELPPRTEIRLDVTLSDAERALYDRHRQAGLAELTLSAVERDGQRRFQALATLTRLRQAACHPRLVEKESTVPATKLKRALRLLEDLRAEGHSALVFSQFVRHLDLVEESLRQRGFGLCRIDGSTPQSKREAEVDRFQAGEADVFLISLKAGGVGLNLTAATYVLHMDPWWNPAAEDQATDRAHRIGQDRPVTVYRLVARHTVEDAILELHGRKRQLVEELLAGTGSSAPMTTDELLELLRAGEVEAPPELGAPAAV